MDCSRSAGVSMGKDRVGATGLEPPTPCTPFGICHVPQTFHFAYLFEYQLLLLFPNFTHFAENGKFREIGATEAAHKISDNSFSPFSMEKNRADGPVLCCGESWLFKI